MKIDVIEVLQDVLHFGSLPFCSGVFLGYCFPFIPLFSVASLLLCLVDEVLDHVSFLCVQLKRGQ